MLLLGSWIGGKAHETGDHLLPQILRLGQPRELLYLTAFKESPDFSHLLFLDSDIIADVPTVAQLFFLTMAKKNKTKIASVIEDDKMSKIGESSSTIKTSSMESSSNWTANRENAIAANIIFFRPDLLYAKIDKANNRIENIPVIA